MSEAPRSTACATIWLTSLMTGASSEVSCRATTSAPSSASSRMPADSPTTSSSLSRREIRVAMSSGGATATRISYPVMIAMSSTASTFDGSAIATSSVRLSAKATGTVW